MARFPNFMELSGLLRIHPGELDDWTPLALCARIPIEGARPGRRDHHLAERDSTLQD